MSEIERLSSDKNTEPYASNERKAGNYNTNGSQEPHGEFVKEAPPNYTNLANSSAKLFGVRKAEILCAQYDTPILRICFFVSAFLCAYCYGLDGTLRYFFQTYATSSYSQHSLYATVNVIRAVVAAAAQPTYARLSDKFGRLELFVVSVVFYAVGTVIESQAYDVNRFAGGAVLYQIGYSGVMLILQVSLADMSTLNWRLFASFIPALPFIINTWVSGDVSASLISKHSWNYSIGIWAFIFPLSCVPLLACYLHMRMKARKTPEWLQIKEEERAEFQGWGRYFKDLFWTLDVVGILFIICVFGFILVPFTIAGGTSSKWKEASTIAPLVVGIVLCPLFVFWEWKFARFPIVPWPLLKDRGVWAALIIACFVTFIYYMPNDFIYTVLIVGMRASVKAALRISSLYSFVSVVTGPLLGLVLTKVRRTKPFIMFGCSVWFVALGLFVHFRGDNDGVDSEAYLNGVIAALCVMGFGAGFFTYVTQVSIETCTNHEYMAVVLSLYLASYNIGSALGATVSGAIWNQLMYGEIFSQMEKIGVDTALAADAYGAPYTFIITYVWETPERIAVVRAYASVQRKLCITGLCLCVPLLVASMFLRNHYLETVQSLDNAHRGEGVHGDKLDITDTVVVNNYDKDPIVDFLKGIFGKKSKKTVVPDTENVN